MTRDHSGVVGIEHARREFRIASEAPLPEDMIGLIAAGGEALFVVSQVEERLGAGMGEEVIIPIEQVQILAPIPRPTKNVFAVGLNYSEHSIEFDPDAPLPSHPIFFSKAATSVIGPGEPIRLHEEYTQAVDYEAELAVVIGRRGVNISREAALNHVFGYTVINDISARDRQRRTSQWFLGKGLDSFCPMGPYLVHKSAIPNSGELEIQSRVNGEVRQHSNTRQLIFDIPQLIEVLSQGMTLEPGDIIATGTCAGVGMGFDPPRYLKDGDIVEIEVERIGVLRNPVQR